MATKHNSIDWARIEWLTAALIAAVTGGFFTLLYVIDWKALFGVGGAPRVENFGFQVAAIDNVGLIMMAAGIGAAIAATLHPRVMWFTLSLLVAAMAVVSMSYYNYRSMELWWLLPMNALLISGGTVYGVKELRRRMRILKLRSSLEWVLPATTLKKIEEETQSINVADREVSATVLAVDIIGLTNIRPNYVAADLMVEMRALYGRVRAVVHARGGVILRSYRGGFTCLFGDLMRKGDGQPFHAEAAVQCAADIQKENAQIAIDSAAKKKPVYVLRAGVSSSRVMIGNLGDEVNIDTLFLGAAIDEAEVLKRSCEAGMVLFSTTTRDLFVKIKRDLSIFQKKVVSVAGRTNETIEVFEFDPCFERPELRRDAVRAMRECANLQRTDERFLFKRKTVVRLETNVGPANIVNVSRGGMAIELDQAVAVGSIVRLKFETKDETLRQRLENRDLMSMSAEIRWTKGVGAGSLHGAMYRALNDNDKAFLLQCLLEAQDSAATRAA